MDRIEALEITKREFVAELASERERVIQLEAIIRTIDVRIGKARTEMAASESAEDAKDGIKNTSGVVNSVRVKDLCAEIIRRNGPMTTLQLYEQLVAMGRTIASPTSVYGTIFREKGKMFLREGDKWLLAK